MSSWYDDCYDDNTGWVSSTVNDWDKGKYRNVMMKSSSISVPGLQTTTQMSSKEWFPEDRGLPIAVQAYVLHILIVVILDTMKTYFVFFIFERE
ncbi:hypothetical protein Q1695_012377 [Nippostrongylus brasiliensis]|nr:hypothetical protein Q1695_012377 [Nippostrongylus brasiliensis]